MERETGIEPATNGLGSRYSTIELLPLRRKLYRARPESRVHDKRRKSSASLSLSLRMCIQDGDQPTEAMRQTPRPSSILQRDHVFTQFKPPVPAKRVATALLGLIKGLVCRLVEVLLRVSFEGISCDTNAASDAKPVILVDDRIDDCGQNAFAQRLRRMDVEV